MSKYIDAVGLKIKLGKRLSDDERRIMEIVKETIDSLPTIDIVHCKDCKYWRTDENVKCRLLPYADANDYCSYADTPF